MYAKVDTRPGASPLDSPLAGSEEPVLPHRLFSHFLVTSGRAAFASFEPLRGSNCVSAQVA